MELCIYFHDVIYDPTKKDNEEQSAVLFLKYAEEEKLDELLKKEVETIILATKNHAVRQPNESLECQVFLDLDLSILGADAATYGIYCENIRKEYSFVPQAAFVKGRTSVFLSFLSMPSLFRTDPGKTAWEAQARHNIATEYAALNKWVLADSPRWKLSDAGTVDVSSPLTFSCDITLTAPAGFSMDDIQTSAVITFDIAFEKRILCYPLPLSNVTYDSAAQTIHVQASLPEGFMTKDIAPETLHNIGSLSLHFCKPPVSLPLCCPTLVFEIFNTKKSFQRSIYY